MMLGFPINRGSNVPFSTDDFGVAWPLSCFVNSISGSVGRILHIKRTYVERRVKSTQSAEMKSPVNPLSHKPSESP